jgi:hypothetical protein
MSVNQPKSVRNLEEKMQDIDQNSLRYQILRSAKDFKTSWIELGRALYTAWKDKLYKTWGYSQFDVYTAKEIGIRKATALKLLRSYYFLEKEEPGYLQQEYTESADAKSVPTFESVDVLRRAKSKKGLEKSEYERLKADVFEKGKEASEVKKDLTALIRQRNELDPDEAREQKRRTTLKRFIGTLRSLKEEAQIAKLLPADLIKEAAELIRKIEEEL